MRFFVLVILSACQLEDFSVDFEEGPKTAPDGEEAVTTPAPINDEGGIWVERECDLESGDLSVTWIVDLEVAVPPPQFTGFHLYPDEMWREPTSTAYDPSGDGILYSWSGAIDCIAWEWMEPMVPAAADTGDTGP